MTAETFKQQMIDRLGQGLWCLALALGLALVPAAAQTGKPDIAEQKYQLGNLLQTLGNLSLVRNANQAAQFYDEALSAYSQAEGSVEKSSFKKAIGQARIRTLCYLIGAHQAKFTPDHEQIIHLHQTNLKLFNVVMNEELPVLNLIASAYVASKNYKEAIEVYRQADSR